MPRPWDLKPTHHAAYFLRCSYRVVLDVPGYKTRAEIPLLLVAPNHWAAQHTMADWARRCEAWSMPRPVAHSVRAKPNGGADSMPWFCRVLGFSRLRLHAYAGQQAALLIPARQLEWGRS